MSEILATSPALPGEAPTIEGRLADIMETTKVVVDDYRLSNSDKALVVAALRMAAGPKWKHLKRGSVVTEIARGFAQVAHHPIDEMSAVVIYRHDEDGRFWVRNAVEFDDGRFAPLSSQDGAK